MTGPDAWDCESDGHDPVVIGTAKDGTVFTRCRKCGKERER